jgi:transposase-like protein
LTPQIAARAIGGLRRVESYHGEAEVRRLLQSNETQMRRRVLEAIERVLEEDSTEALGTGRYERRAGATRRSQRAPDAPDA